MDIQRGAFREEIRRAVAAAERGTSAELVVVLARASGSYRDVAYLGGLMLACVGLALALFAPWSVRAAFVLPNVVLLFALGAVVTGRVPALVRLLSAGRGGGRR